MMITTSRPPSIRSTTTETGDPLSALMRPPPTETEREKRLRLEREADAKKVNDLIDDQIRADRERYKKSKQDVKVILVSTTSASPILCRICHVQTLHNCIRSNAMFHELCMLR